MRLNKYIALATGLSRRSADDLIKQGRVHINDTITHGAQVGNNDVVKLDKIIIKPATTEQIILLNKPVGYVVSRNGQGSRTVYDLLPDDLYHLKPVGRLDKDSSGLLLLTNSGDLANKLTHPSYQKEKTYEVSLDKPLSDRDRAQLEKGVTLEDGISKFKLSGSQKNWKVIISEGRNRQIRRTFWALKYGVVTLNRTHFGEYTLPNIAPGTYKEVS